MDDIGFLGPIDESADEKRATLKVVVDTNEGKTILLSKDILDKNSFKQLYLPRLDRSVHASFVGYSPEGTKYYRFYVQDITLEEYMTYIRYEFMEGGWYEEGL